MTHTLLSSSTEQHQLLYGGLGNWSLKLNLHREHAVIKMSVIYSNLC